MNLNERDTVLSDVRRALGRDPAARQSAPAPPDIDEPITRLVHSDIGLGELFARMARQNQMHVASCRADELLGKLVALLRAHGCRRIAVADSGAVASLGIVELLRHHGFDIRCWHEMSLDELYDCDAAVTPVDFAIAETGSLVIRGSASHGRALSLVPPIHIAIVEPRTVIADLVDLFEILSRDAEPANTVIITGPSKTADIEMNLVTGVHGPGVVGVFILQ